MIKPIIRLAQDSEGEQIRAILSECHQIPNGLDWSRVYPSWLVAEHSGKIVGCAQVIIGFPLSHFGFWGVLPAYQSMGIGIFLWWAVEKFIADGGSDGFTGMTTNPKVVEHLTEKGGIVFGDKPSNVIFKRVYRKGAEVNHGQQSGIQDDDSGANGSRT